MLICCAASAQSVEPYYADTTVYDNVSIRIDDDYSSISQSGCRLAGYRASTSVEGRLIRVTIEPIAPEDCNGPFPDFRFRIRNGLGTRLAAGRYDLEYGYRINGTYKKRATSSMQVSDGVSCSRTPSSNGIAVGTTTTNMAERIQRAVLYPTLEPALRALLNGPVDVRMLTNRDVLLMYYALDDIQPTLDAIQSSSSALGIGYVEGGPGIFTCTGVFPAPPPRPIIFVEYFNAQLRHYFITADEREVAAIDRGDAGPGWSRTGERMTGVRADGCTVSGTSFPAPVYRFVGTPGKGPNSHFLTMDRQECAATRLDRGWTFEQISATLWAPVEGRCPPTSLAVHRIYNGSWRENDSNHRYSAKRSVIDAMVGAGWVDEGVSICIPQ